jgi:hypothetical protein
LASYATRQECFFWPNVSSLAGAQILKLKRPEERTKRCSMNQS